MPPARTTTAAAAAAAAAAELWRRQQRRGGTRRGASANLPPPCSRRSAASTRPRVPTTATQCALQGQRHTRAAQATTAPPPPPPPMAAVALAVVTTGCSGGSDGRSATSGHSARPRRLQRAMRMTPQHLCTQRPRARAARTRAAVGAVLVTAVLRGPTTVVVMVRARVMVMVMTLLLPWALTRTAALKGAMPTPPQISMAKPLTVSCRSVVYRVCLCVCVSVSVSACLCLHLHCFNPRIVFLRMQPCRNSPMAQVAAAAQIPLAVCQTQLCHDDGSYRPRAGAQRFVRALFLLLLCLCLEREGQGRVRGGGGQRQIDTQTHTHTQPRRDDSTRCADEDAQVD